MVFFTNMGGGPQTARHRDGGGKGRVQNMPGSQEEEIVELYNSFYDRVFGYCVYRLFRRDLAEDAAAEVFLLLVEKYPLLRHGDRMSIRNWLYGTASNIAARYLRDAGRRREIAEALARAGTASGGTPRYDRLDWPVLYEAMGQLSVEDQEVVALRYFEGLETRQIAGALGIRHVTARVRLSRAVKKLRKKVGKAFGEAYATT